MAQSKHATWQDAVRAPEFGGEVAHRPTACTPRELFARLFESAEDSVHYFEPAFVFALDALTRAPVPGLEQVSDAALPDALSAWAQSTLPAASRTSATAWPTTVVEQFAPVGLSDGCWLSGSMLANAIENETGMRLLRQLMTRLGDPGSTEGYAQRYAGLLRSLGVAPGLVTGDEPAAAILDVSCEHALLGLAIGLFPTTFAGETLGFNLWMAAIGPCPLLEHLGGALEARGACLRYLERHDRPALLALARDAIGEALAECASATLRDAIVRGFAAAHDSYLRWARAVEALHADHSAGSAPLAPVGAYAPPQDPESLRSFAIARYGSLSMNELYFCLANADLHPGVRVFARVFVSGVLSQLSRALDDDERLNSRVPPAYSERDVALIVAEQHLKNVRSRERWTPEQTSSDGTGEAADDIHAIFDGCWLQGFADVRRAEREEYGWLFRIYASEHGDGDLSWNHCQIFRRAYAELGPDVMLPKADRALYDLFRINVSAAAKLAVSLNTRHFLPEILGMNLGIEATGVGGDYMERWKRARKERSKWKELAYRLHNSIDNYADGHTKWSLAAVQAYMRRVSEADPAEVHAHWHRIWRLWRFQDLVSHGSASEREALREHFEVRSLAPM